MPPWLRVDVAGLEAVLKHDLEPVLKSGPLAPGTGGGATIGVWKHGEQRVFAYGAAKPDSIFEIGSITKTFTGSGAGANGERGQGHASMNPCANCCRPVRWSQPHRQRDYAAGSGDAPLGSAAYAEQPAFDRQRTNPLRGL